MYPPPRHEVEVVFDQAFAAQCGDARYGPPTLSFTYRQSPGGNSGGRLSLAAAKAMIKQLQESLVVVSSYAGDPCIRCGRPGTANYDALENRLVSLCASCHHRECNHGEGECA